MDYASSYVLVEDWVTWLTQYLYWYYCEYQSLLSRVAFLNAVCSYDLAGAMVFDSSPRFSLYTGLGIPGPNGSIQSMPQRLQGLFLRSAQKPDMVAAVEAMLKMSHISTAINERGRASAFWKKDIDGLLLISPALHFLLSMPRLPNNYMRRTNHSDLVARELVRLTCLTIISLLKERLKFFTVERAGLQARLVQFIAANIRSVGPEYFDIKVWVLITGALMEQRSLRDLYIIEIKHIMMITNISAGNLVRVAQEMVWIDALASSSANELIQDITMNFTTSCES